MGWRFYKSINLGLLRLNFSKSGLGASIGFGGLRLGLSGMKRPYFSYRVGPFSYFSRLRNSSKTAEMETLQDTEQLGLNPSSSTTQKTERPLTPNEALLRNLKDFP
jgi:hypothetical protein